MTRLDEIRRRDEATSSCHGEEDRRWLLEQVDRLSEAARRIVDFDPNDQEPADAAWVFPKLLSSLTTALAALEARRRATTAPPPHRRLTNDC